MNSDLKRIYAAIQEVQRVYRGAAQRRFLFDRTPFNQDESRKTEIETTLGEQYCLVIGRVLPTVAPYGQGVFEMELKIPMEFPFKAPQVRLLTPIYHINVGDEGLLCLPMLRSTDSWESTYTLVDVINSVVTLIDHPCVFEAFSAEMAEEYVNNRREYDRKALESIRNNPVSREPLEDD